MERQQKNTEGRDSQGWEKERRRTAEEARLGSMQKARKYAAVVWKLKELLGQFLPISAQYTI